MFHRSPDLSMFLMDPEYITYSHYPFDEQWQLLEKPISKDININVKTPMSQTRNGCLHNEEKAQSSLFSEVVQRYSGDEKVIC